MLIRFEPRGVEASADEGERVADVCDRTDGHGVPFECRSANCGSCRAQVLEGGERLAPPGADELRVLDGLGEDPGRVRLACQLLVRAGSAGRIVLRVAAERQPSAPERVLGSEGISLRTSGRGPDRS